MSTFFQVAAVERNIYNLPPKGKFGSLHTGISSIAGGLRDFECSLVSRRNVYIGHLTTVTDVTSSHGYKKNFFLAIC